MQNFCDLTIDELTAWCLSQNEPKFHVNQIIDWVYRRGTLDWNEMSNLSKSLREKLSSSFRLPVLHLEKISSSPIEPIHKFTWKTQEGARLEAVLECSDKQRIATLSSQLGCPGKCSFCGSGRKGFLRNLRPCEIVEQLLYMQNWLRDQEMGSLTHLSFRGMGEPLKNLDPILKAIQIATDPTLFAIQPKNITLSTIGVTEGIKRLTQENLEIRLIFSLNAPNQKIREKVIPYAKKYPLNDLMVALEEYRRKRGEPLEFEYTLIEGVNDHPDHAYELAHLLAHQKMVLHLTLCNEFPGSNYKAPEKKAIKEFRTVLFGCKIPHQFKESKGAEVFAAMGQLLL